MKIETTFLRSKVARRIFVLFVTCALLPIITLVIVSFYQVSGELQRHNELELQQASKTKGMAILERLDALDIEMQTAVTDLQKAIAPRDEIRGHFSGITRLQANGKAQTVYGEAPNFAPLTQAEMQHLHAGKSLLLTRPCSDDSAPV